LSKNILEVAKNRLLVPFEISELSLENLLSGILTHQVDMADMYFQSEIQESWVLEEGIIKDGSFSRDYGVGIRAISGEKTGFAYSDDIILPALEQAATAARSIATTATQVQPLQAWQRSTELKNLYSQQNPLESIKNAEKVALLKKIEQVAKQADSRVSRVTVSLSGTHETILILGSDGTYSADIRPLVRLNVNVVVESKGRHESASMGGGGRGDYTQFFENNLGESFAKEAVRQALVSLEAVPAPAGTMPVVLGPGWPGILLHEAIGHGLEGDFNRKGSSAFSGKIGERVATPECTIVDDGTLPGRRGSLNIDDEGTPTQKTVLIEKGILKNYMQDKLNAKLMGGVSTGNGRRESYACLPMPRMTNTYMLAGKHDPDEIIKSVERGLYAPHFGGGQVDITSGKFVFNASEAYLIEKGKVTTPVKGATLIGHGPDVLTKVKMVGNNLELDHGMGTCGKEGQSVPVGVGQPTLLIDEITVGGTHAG
jgi:TldD protein